MATDKRGYEALGRIADLDIDPLKYYELVADFNILLLNELGHQLSGLREKLGVAVSITTPGSDGRQEAGSYASPYEAIILTNEDVDLNLLEQSVKKIIEEAAPGRIVNFEVKGPHSSLAAYKDNPKILQPGRIADARLIPGAGDRTDVGEAKVRLGRELIQMPSKRIDDIAGLRRDAARATAEGKNRIGGQDIVHFDLTTNTVFFNPHGTERSFKIGPLRLVQNTLLIEEIRHTRKTNEPDFISTLHSGIVNRLGQLSDDKMISLGKEFVRELQNHYAFFLRLYHQSEHAYTQDGLTSRQLSPGEVDEVAKRLAALQELTNALKIQKQALLPSRKST